MPLEQFRLWAKATIDKYFQKRLEFVASASLALTGLFMVFQSQPLSYAWMASVAPLWVWGSLLMAVGAISRIAIYFSHYPSRQVSMLIVGGLRMGMLLAVGYGTQWHSNLLPEFMSWVLISAWAYMRIDVDDPLGSNT